jgi:hypothetical protein
MEFEETVMDDELSGLGGRRALLKSVTVQEEEAALQQCKPMPITLSITIGHFVHTAH